MIIFHRQAVLAPGKLLEGVEFAGKIAAHVNSLTPDAEVRASMGVGGTVGTLHWTGHYPDMGEMERSMDAYMADAAYLQMITQAGELFVAGSVKDEILKTLD